MIVGDSLQETFAVPKALGVARTRKADDCVLRERRQIGDTRAVLAVFFSHENPDVLFGRIGRLYKRLRARRPDLAEIEIGPRPNRRLFEFPGIVEVPAIAKIVQKAVQELRFRVLRRKSCEPVRVRDIA